MSSPVPNLTHGMSTPDSDRQQSRAKRLRIPKTSKPSDNKIQIPTAALQDRLLPRRRQRRAVRQGASRFEVFSESDEDHLSSAAPDDDELSYLPLQRRSQTQRTINDQGEPNSNHHEGDQKSLKRYGAKSHEDAHASKENEPADLSSPLSSALDSDELESQFDLEPDAPVKAYLSEELRMQALKFAEVDKWKMEFEDVIIASTQENGAFR